jgi:uncharacterized lipoprotein YehR (DUF1307 family)
MTHQFKGYHGTSISSAKEIIKSNYDLSIGDKEWLGNGVYFFIEGINSKPDEQAKNWAIAQSWDNTKLEYKYKEYCVIKSIIKVKDDDLLDLTKEEGVEVLNYLLKCFEKKIEKLNKKFNYIDGLLINLARSEGILPIDVVKGNFYIKFAQERIKGINLRTPNCTICTVFRPNKNIVDSTIITTGDIKDETK